MKKENQDKTITEKGKNTILPKNKTLNDMLAIVTPENIHAEIQTGSSVGHETLNF